MNKWLVVILFLTGFYYIFDKYDLAEVVNSDVNAVQPAPVSLIDAARAKYEEELIEQKTPQELEFISSVTDYSTKFKSAKNELQESVLRDERAAVFSSLLKGRSVDSWVGTIEELSTNNDGKAVLSIRISPDIKIRTWNNALSDLGSNTLIEKNTSLYSTLLELSAGQNVFFSGTFPASKTDFIKEGSLTINGSMTNPDFILKFDSVTPF